MKSFRGTIVFGLLVGVIVAFALAEFRKSRSEEETQAEKNHIYRGIVPEGVKEFSAKGVKAYKLKREATGWQVVEPLVDDADEAAIDTALREMLSYNVEALDDEDSKPDPAIYGLTQPLAEFSFITNDGQEHKVALGQTRTYDRGYYILRDGEPGILIGDQSWDSLVGKTANDFRNKQILFPDGNFERLKISSKLPRRQSNLDLTVKDGRWAETKNPSVKIDQMAVRDYFSSLRQLRADGILENAKNDKLNAADLSIEIKVAGHDTVIARFARGPTATSEATMWNSLAKTKSLYRVPKTKVEELAKSLNDFRDKAVPFTFASAQAARVEIKKNKGKEVKVFEKQGENWVNVGKAEEKANGGEVANLLTGLAALKAAEFLSSSTKVPAEHEISIKDAQGASLFKFVFGGVQKDSKGEETYLAKTSLAGEPVRVMKSAIDVLWNKSLVEAPAVGQPEKKAEDHAHDDHQGHSH